MKSSMPARTRKREEEALVVAVRPRRRFHALGGLGSLVIVPGARHLLPLAANPASPEDLAGPRAGFSDRRGCALVSPPAPKCGSGR